MNALIRIFEYLEDFNSISIALRLILATILGAMIGMERGATRHAAGLRTFTLVCLGAALAQIVDIGCVLTYGSGDPVRLAQGVISGIGFLGVGTIVVTGGSHIKGLTTAATLWTTAVLGISIGAGYLFSSLITFLLIMFVVKIMANYSRRQQRQTKEIEVQVDVENREGVKGLISYIRDKGYVIESFVKKDEGGYISVTTEIDLGKKISHENVIEEMSGLPSVLFVEELF
ncbi:MAG: MgtC/SapB family protein [Alistipes sp.]|nr:MgtC/SapB family protein [Alistipes sp.]